MNVIRYSRSCAITNRDRFDEQNQKNPETPGTTQTELLTMATHALPASHILDNHDATDDSVRASNHGPTIMRRVYDAMVAMQQRRAQREIDRVLGTGAFSRAVLDNLHRKG
jgi:uncharacterized protein YbjT (DUF2867 family)